MEHFSGADKDRAHIAVTKALRIGQLIRPDVCQECGIACIPHAHHEDYNKELEVDWLCRKCHPKRHNYSKNNNKVAISDEILTDIEQRSILAAKELIFGKNPFPIGTPPPLSPLLIEKRGDTPLSREVV